MSAALLKEQGNVLFAERKHDEAATKYTEAIALDGMNAVLFANRAACWLALQRCVRFRMYAGLDLMRA
jgi:hypothetical protein